MWTTRVTQILNIAYPIVQGGMSIPGNGALAAAVSNGGGLGMVGLNPGWTPRDEQLGNLRKHIRQAKSLTDKPFGVNVPLFARPEELGRTRDSIELAIDEGVPVISTSGGDPTVFTQRIKDAGLKVIHVALNVKMAKKAEQAGVDIIVASGVDAGGVLGPDEIPTMALVPMVVDAVSVPVLAAGGIADGRGFVAALALGAEGIQMGTRFMATKECHIHENFKHAIVLAGDTDTIIAYRNAPPKKRGLKSKFIMGLVELDHKGAGRDEYLAYLGMDRTREASMEGEMEDGAPLCGVCVGLIGEIISATEVVKNIVEDASSILRRVNMLEAQLV